MVKRKQIQNFSTFIENSKIFEVLNTLEKEGFEAYLAGGAVRDMLLGKHPHDFDVATNARPKDIKRLFPKHLTRGERFGTITVIIAKASHKSLPIALSINSLADLTDASETFEVTTYRSEDVYTDSRHPDLIKFSDNIFEDSKRRDFTINGIYADKEGRVLDPQNGMQDLELKILRTIGDPKERFEEDALRVLRALRFTSQLGFELEAKTLSSALDHWSLLSKVSVERTFEELKKMILGSYFLNVLTLIMKHNLFDQFVESKLITSSPESNEYLDRRLNAYKDSEYRFEFFMLDFALVNSKNLEDYLKNWVALFPFRKNEKNRIEDAVYLIKILQNKQFSYSVGKIIALSLKIWPINELKLFLTKELLSFLNLDLAKQDLILNILMSLNKNPTPKVKGQELMSHGIKAGPGLRQKLDLAFELQLENPDLSVDQLIERTLRFN